MKRSFRLGRVFGVEVGLHYSWFVLAALIVLSLAAQFHFAAPGAPASADWIGGLATAFLFFAGLLLHELSHVAVARAHGMRVRGITLFALGGMARAADEPRDPGTELLIGLVGPATSAGLGLACLGIARLIAQPAALSLPVFLCGLALAWLGLINIGLAAFNLLPGYPLDGGRVVRAAIWKATGSRERATRAASAVGQVVGLALVALGAAALFLRGSFGGLWLGLIGFFLYQAASASAVSAGVYGALSRVRVADIMRPDCLDAEPSMALETVVNDRMLRRGRARLFVRSEAQLLGVVTPREVGRVPRERWATTTVAQAMVPSTRVRTIKPEASALDALELMSRENASELPVVDDDGLEGFVTQEDILRTLEARRELAVAGEKS